MGPKLIIGLLVTIALVVWGVLGWAVFVKPSTSFDTGYFKTIGINTTDPEYTLDIEGDVGWSGSLQSGNVPWTRLSDFPENCQLGQFIQGVGEQLICEVPSLALPGTITWTSLADFPTTCPAGQFVKGLGEELVCEAPSLSLPGSISWLSLADFPTTCPAGQFVQAIGSDLTCAAPPAGGGGGGGLSGSGTINHIAKWAGANTLGNSIIYDTGVNVGIGSTHPSTRLSILSNVDDILKLVRTGASSSYLWALGTDGKLVLKDQENNVRFALDTDGNVGIGTVDPDQKLEVAGYVKGTGLCIGSDCRTDWPSGSGGGGDGDITAVLPGTGLSGGGTSGSVTLSSDTDYLQRRITEQCPAGSAIRTVTDDGTVICQSVGDGGGGIGGSGTAGRLTRWIGSTTLGNSAIFQIGSNIGIGIESPSYTLEVNGTAQADIFYANTGISTFDSTVSHGTIEASQFCLDNGTNCITSWPAGNGGAGGGDITAVLPGTGLSGGGDSGSVTLSVDTSYLQRRVADSCTQGSAIRLIGANGAVICESVGGAAGGTVTQINEGEGITLSPNPITTTGTISADTTYLQRRVSGTCADNSAIRVINSDGTVTCQSVAGGGGISGSGTATQIPYFVGNYGSLSTTLTSTINLVWVEPNTLLVGNVGVGGKIASFGDIWAQNQIEAQSICIGTDCRSSWPSDGGGGFSWSASCEMKNRECPNDNSCYVSCSSGKKATGGGCSAGASASNLRSSLPDYPAGQPPIGWECVYNSAVPRLFAWVICCTQ